MERKQRRTEGKQGINYPPPQKGHFGMVRNLYPLPVQDEATARHKQLLAVLVWAVSEPLPKFENITSKRSTHSLDTITSQSQYSSVVQRAEPLKLNQMVNTFPISLLPFLVHVKTPNYNLSYVSSIQSPPLHLLPM
jgi:hypothetical protein